MQYTKRQLEERIKVLEDENARLRERIAVLEERARQDHELIQVAIKEGCRASV
jgi:hypothetical protein